MPGEAQATCAAGIVIRGAAERPSQHRAITRLAPNRGIDIPAPPRRVVHRTIARRDDAPPLPRSGAIERLSTSPLRSGTVWLREEISLTTQSERPDPCGQTLDSRHKLITGNALQVSTNRG